MKHWVHPLLIDEGSFDEVWSREQETEVLFVVGSGFDPRASAVLGRLVAATSRRVEGLMIELPEDSTDLAMRPLAAANRAQIAELVERTGGQLHHQPLPEYHDARALGRLISRHFQQSDLLGRFAEVVLDVSAMPRSIFFPVIRGVLERAHAPEGSALHWAGDLHVAVCENPEADQSVLEEGTTPMAPIGGFAGAQREGARTTIWVPVLGEGASARVKALFDELEPDETCPVLPWPARNPRRADDLLLEYRRLLFEEIHIEPGNVIHAAERNPFDLYRTLGALHARYQQSLSPLGTVSMVLSSHSSKLLSVGVLLTAYDHGLVVQHVSPSKYGLHEDTTSLRDHDEIYDLWLTGEPYR